MILLTLYQKSVDSKNDLFIQQVIVKMKNLFMKRGLKINKACLILAYNERIVYINLYTIPLQLTLGFSLHHFTQHRLVMH